MALSALMGVDVPVLAGCDLPGTFEGKDGSVSPSGSVVGGSATALVSTPAQAGSTEWQKLDGHVIGRKMSMEASPIIRQDDKTSYIAVKLIHASGDTSIDAVGASSHSSKDNELNISSYLGAGPFRVGTRASLAKLLDTASECVWSAVNGSELFPELAPGEGMTSYLSSSKVDTDTVIVMIPMANSATVSVLDAGSAKKVKIDLSIAQTTLKQSSHDVPELADSVTIERYTRALNDFTNTQAGGKNITVTLANDVTFTSGSADLAPGAEAQFNTVASQLDQYPDGGILTVVGHTDDAQDDVYNQALSEKHANAIKIRLAQFTKFDERQTSVSGKGGSEPKARDTTDEARATSRRVEITLTPTGGTAPKNTATPALNTNGGGKLPDPQGLVAKGPKSVTLTSESGSTRGGAIITLDHVTCSGGYLPSTVTCTIKDGLTSAQLHPPLGDPKTALINQRSESGILSTFYASGGLTLLSDGECIFPTDYNNAGVDHHLPLAGLSLSNHLKTGTTTICIVWPDPGGDIITLDHPEGKYPTPNTTYHFINIPIRNN